VFSDECRAYDFGGGHPLNSIRLTVTLDLIHELGLDAPPRGCVHPSRPATADELALMHDPGYVAAVRELSRNPGHPLLAHRYGFGLGDNPPFKGMHEAAAWIAGGALESARAIADGVWTHAFHLSGGLHHAGRARASGFCVYNDVALACAFLRLRNLRVLCVDGDAHHGDGTESLFAGTSDILTVSLHESGEHLFPGTGFVEDRGFGAGEGYAVNVPLQPGTGDDSWLECFDLVVPPLAAAFRPDVIVSQHGCDAHARDPLAHLACTTEAAEGFASRIHTIAHAFANGRWLATGGGGYDVWGVVPRAWALAYGVISHQVVADAVPETWRQRWTASASTALPTRMRDDGGRRSPAEVRAANRETALRARDGCLSRIT
jgi:acetoin utilization protein AcuC